MKIAAALRGGWRALEQAFWSLVLSSAIVAAPEALMMLARTGSSSVRRLVILALALALVRFVVVALLRGGQLELHAAALRAEPTSLRILFTRWRSAPQMAAGQVLRAAFAVSCGIVAALPMLVFASLGGGRVASELLVVPVLVMGVFGYAFGSISVLLVEWVVSIEKLAPVAAFRAIYGRSRPHRPRLLALFLLTSVVEALGVLVGLALFGIGLVFTVPATRAFTTAVLTHAYMQIRVNARDRGSNPALVYWRRHEST